MRPVIFWGLAIVLALGAAGARGEELQSGLQPGELVGAFNVEKCAGAVNDGRKAGDNFCYRCMLGNKPVVMVFARKADDKLAGLVKELDAAVAKHADQKLSSFVNLIGPHPDELKVEAKEFAKKNNVENVALVVPNENENGPEEFKINPHAELTVMIYREGKVVANHALPAGKLDKTVISSILSDAGKILK